MHTTVQRPIVMSEMKTVSMVAVIIDTGYECGTEVHDIYPTEITALEEVAKLNAEFAQNGQSFVAYTCEQQFVLSE